MRRPIIVVFLSLFLMACQALGAERGALFRITGEGHTLYLYGTIHAGKPDYYPLEPRIHAALAAAPTLALEVDMAADPNVATAAFREHALFTSAGEGLASLAPARRVRIERALKRQGIDPASVAQIKPWMLATMLGMVNVSKLGYTPALGVDTYLAGLVRGKVRIAALESMQYQAGLLDRLPLATQWALLEETLGQMASGRQLRETRELFAAYDRADRKALERIARRIESDDSIGARAVRELVLNERNGPMADKLAALLAREDNVVAAIGVMHLLGRGSVPELLRQRGMRVERIY